MATKPPRLYVPLDVYYMDDPKVEGLSLQAEMLWVRMLCEAKKRPLRAGFVSKSALKGNATAKLRGIDRITNELVDAELIAPAMQEGRPGFEIVSWLSWNMSEDEAGKVRRTMQERGYQRAHRAGQHAESPRDECPDCSASEKRSAERTAKRPASKRREEKTKSSTSIPPYPQRDSVPGGSGVATRSTPDLHPDDWKEDRYRPRAYRYDHATPHHGGWDGGAWIQPAEWRDGWGPKGQHPTAGEAA